MSYRENNIQVKFVTRTFYSWSVVLWCGDKMNECLFYPLLRYPCLKQGHRPARSGNTSWWLALISIPWHFKPHPKRWLGIPTRFPLLKRIIRGSRLSQATVLDDSVYFLRLGIHMISSNEPRMLFCLQWAPWHLMIAVPNMATSLNYLGI